MSNALQSLSAPESADKSRLEHVVQSGIKAGRQANEALREIRDRRLYRDEAATFAEYLQTRWEMSRSRGYQLIAAVEVTESLPTRHKGKIVNESQARAIASVPEAKRAEVMDLTDAEPGPVTADKIKRASARVLQPEPEPAAPETPPEDVHNCGHSDDDPEEPNEHPGAVVSEPLPGDDSVAMYRARMAVQELELIPANDPGRSEALLWVALQISNMPQ